MTGSSPRQASSSRDRDFLTKVQKIVQQHIADPLFTTAAAADCLASEQDASHRWLRAPDGAVDARPSVPFG
jgi:hypothetical protein